MALPRKLKGMNLFNNANSYQGVVTAVTLPKLARKLDPFRAGGMSGAAFIDNGLEDDALDVEWSIGGIDELVLTQWGASDIPLRFTGSYQRDDTRPDGQRPDGRHCHDISLATFRDVRHAAGRADGLAA